MSDIKKGDLVKLKSGGPVMTVQEIDDYTMKGSKDDASCVWFDGTEPKEKVFELSTLIRYEGP
jgi:uncharacterized protein YodC (DUF2158 family)